MKALWLLFVFMVACSASKDDGASLGIDCGQEVGTVARVDGGGLAEVQRGVDAGAGVDACQDAGKAAERAADLPEGGKDAAPETSQDAGAGVDIGAELDGGAFDSQPLDLGTDAQCPNPRTIPIQGNCMICGIVGGPCCFTGAPCDQGFTCSNFACVVKL